MGDSKNNNFLFLAEVINSKSDYYDKIANKLCISQEVADLDKFKSRLLRQMNEIDCTPTKEGATVEEIRELFNEIENVPVKLQKQRKQKELPRLNSTMIQRKDSNKDCTKRPMQNMNQTFALPNSVSSDVSTAKVDCLLTPREILRNFNESKSILEETLAKFDKDSKHMKHYSNELGAIKNFLTDLEAITKHPDDRAESKEESLSEKEESEVIALTNVLEQYKYIQENKNLFEIIENNTDSEQVNALMDIVNDLLKNII